jgi:quercetin dioxygenase-like cupin family protein
MGIKKIEQIKREVVGAGVKTFKQLLISPEEAPNFAMRKFIIEPGGSMPLHTNLVEHEQYVLNGKAEIIIGDEVITVQKDDIVFIPSEIEHSYRTIGNEAFEFLCMVPNKEDKIILK